MGSESASNVNEEVTPTPAAERMRLHRKRRREGWLCMMIELHVTEIDELAAQGFLAEANRGDRQAIMDALYRYFDRYLGGKA